MVADAKKSASITMSHLRFGKNPIQSTYLIISADYIACHNPSYVDKYDLLEGIKENGTFVLNCPWDIKEMESKLPNSLKKTIADKKLKFYTIDAVKIAENIGLCGRINMVMHTAFFKLSKVLPIDDAISYLKEAVEETYGSKGKETVEMNWKSIDATLENINEIHYPDSWVKLKPVYSLKGTGIRVNASYTDRWALFELVGADAFTPVHSAGALTRFQVPEIAFNAVALDLASARPMILAAGVAKALITTVFGLIVGIPAMGFYAYFRRRAARMVSHLETASTDVLAALLSRRTRMLRADDL